MGDFNEGLWQEFFFDLVHKKIAEGKSGNEAYLDALQDLDRIFHGPDRSPAAGKELREKMDKLTSEGLSRPRAYAKVANEYLNDLRKTDVERLAAFQNQLLKDKEKLHEDPGLSPAKDLAVEGFLKKAGLGALKNVWGDFWDDRSEHKTYLQFLSHFLRVGIEETGKSAMDELRKELNNRSLPELRALTEKMIGQGGANLTFQELAATTAANRFERDLFDQLKLGRDAERAVEKLGMINLEGKTINELSTFDLALEGNRGRKAGFDWDLSPKGSANFRIDKFAEEGFEPSVVAKIKLGLGVKGSYSTDFATVRAELEADGTLDLENAMKWRAVFGRDYVERHSSAKALLKAGVDIRPSTVLKLSIEGSAQADINNKDTKGSFSASLSVEYFWDGDETTRARRGKLYPP